ncbi:hypothetical protein ACEPAI_3128 [Sanghuangporus weigelae]
MTTAFIFITDGTEEMEFTITYDTLVRAGVKCVSVFVPSKAPTDPTQKIATCARGVKIIADVTLREVLATNASESADLLVVPGGAKGAATISGDNNVQKLIKRQLIEKDKWVGMICAGPLAAKTSGLPRQPLTSHPSVKSELDKDYDYREDAVVVSGRLVTSCVLCIQFASYGFAHVLIAVLKSRGPGTTFPFALKLVELLLGSEKRNKVQDPMVFPATAGPYLM